MNDEASATYVVGLDFGTLSVRAAVVRVSDGAVLADAVSEYATGVLDRALTTGDGRLLPPDFALEVPADYLRSLEEVVPPVLEEAGIDPAGVVGIGLDATSASVLVTDAEGAPLCERSEFVDEPEAYIKLWKHHGAQPQVERIIDLARSRQEPWLARYGGTLSSEMLLPKALETLERAPQVYAAADEIVDLVDWLTWRLTGTLAYAAGDSGYKRMYQDRRYPSREFLEELNPDFGGVYEEKMSHPVVPLGSRVGGLTDEWARRLGLREGTAVAAGNIDAHVHAASLDAVRPGQLTGVLGTSSCWIVPAPDYHDVPGTFGVVEGGVGPGAWWYEGGQSSVGDAFQWFVDTCVPASYYVEAGQRGISIHDLLTEKASRREIGENGLIALDWWNGNRSILVDASLTGLMIGQTISTLPEDQFRAMLEATAFGARVIIENFEEHGVPIDEIRVAGGLVKNALLMQMYADVTRRRLFVASQTQAGAHGSAIFAAVAAGAYPDLASAAAAMGGVSDVCFEPDEDRSLLYDRLFERYRHLYDLLGREDDTMHALKAIRADAMARRGARAAASDE